MAGGLNVAEFFAGTMCGGLRVVLEARYKVACYAAVEVDDLSCAIAWRVVGKFQDDFPGPLPHSAIRGWFKRLPHDICFVGENHIRDLVRDHSFHRCRLAVPKYEYYRTSPRIPRRPLPPAL